MITTVEYLCSSIEKNAFVFIWNGHGYCISSGKFCKSNLNFIIFRPCSTVLLRLDFTSYVLSNFSFLRPIFCPCNFSLVRFFVVHFLFFQLLWYNFQVVLTAVDVGYLVLTSFYDIWKLHNIHMINVSSFRKQIVKPWILSKKMNKWIHFYYYATCFCSVFGRNWRHQKILFKLPDL